jgi:sugar transferase (PEP-CTERM/EpsH1 system associated)
MRPRVLYITHRVPWPPDRGDRIRTWHVLKYLSKRADVDLISLADEPVTEATRNQLRQVTRQLAILPHTGFIRYVTGITSLIIGRSITEGLFQSSSLKHVLEEWNDQHDYHAALASSSGIARYILPPFLNQSCTRWVDLIDVDSQKWVDYSKASAFPASLIYQLEGLRLRRVESRLADQCSRLLVVSDAERDLLRSFCPRAPVSAVGNGVDSDYFAPCEGKTADPHSCVFVGVMNYKPNVDGAVWFAREVWPGIRKRYPDARFRIVGRSPSAEVLALNEVSGIQVTGAVDDVRTWLYQSTCAVVPLRIARGVQNKVLEAMSCGKPVICSPEPLKGLNAEPGLHLLKADAPDEWVHSISRVFEDTGLQQDLGLAGSAFVQIHHSWDRCLAELDDMFETSRPDHRTVMEAVQ